MNTAIEDIVEERRQQVEDHEWDAEHDDLHVNGELALAAISYAAPVSVYTYDGHPHPSVQGDAPVYVDPWPWEVEYDKRLRVNAVLVRISLIPAKVRYQLVKRAAALLVAEMERLQRIIDRE